MTLPNVSANLESEELKSALRLSSKIERTTVRLSEEYLFPKVDSLFGHTVAMDLLANQRRLNEAQMIHVELNEEGARLRDEGIQRSADHAEAAVPDWGDMAFKAALRYCGRMKGNTFTADQLRSWAERYNFPDPPDKRAWGSVFRRLSSKGHVVVAGYVPSNDPKSHCSPSTLWRSA